MIKIALKVRETSFIYPPFFHKKFNDNLPAVDGEFGLFPHIGSGCPYPCSFYSMRATGFDEMERDNTIKVIFQ